MFLAFVLGAMARPQRSQHIFRAAAEDECPKGVHIVGVRGTLKKAGFGAMQDIVDQLKKKLSGSDDFAIDYPASGITIDDDGKPKYNFFSSIPPPSRRVMVR